MSRSERRTSVVLNYLSVAVIAVSIDMRETLGWGTLPAIVITCGALALGLVTFMRVYWRTGLWSITHAGFKGLDERQVQVVYEALRNSYWIFAVVALIILYANAILGKGHIPILVAGSVLYSAHTLPAAVVAWTEREVPAK
jgi:hypothetical protein